MFVGVLLLLLGILLDKMNIIYGDAWDYFLPVALVALGVSFIVNSKKEKKPH